MATSYHANIISHRAHTASPPDAGTNGKKKLEAGKKGHAKEGLAGHGTYIQRGGNDEDDCDGCRTSRDAGRLVTRNIMALPTARGTLKDPCAGVFSAKLVMRTLYDTARRY